MTGFPITEASEIAMSRRILYDKTLPGKVSSITPRNESLFLPRWFQNERAIPTIFRG